MMVWSNWRKQVAASLSSMTVTVPRRNCWPSPAAPVEELLGRLDVTAEWRPDVDERARVAVLVGRPGLDLDECGGAADLEDEAARLPQTDVIELVDEDPLDPLRGGFDRGHRLPPS